ERAVDTASRVRGIGARARRRVRMQCGQAGSLKQPQQNRNRQSGGGKGHDDARDHQRLRHWVATEPRCRTPARHDAEEHEHPAAEEIESENFAKRLRIHDHAVQPETYHHWAAHREHRRGAHRPALRSGVPASSKASVTAIVTVMATSIATISGLAYTTG